jgi:hypothetical protein
MGFVFYAFLQILYGFEFLNRNFWYFFHKSYFLYQNKPLIGDIKKYSVSNFSYEDDRYDLHDENGLGHSWGKDVYLHSKW